MGALDIALMALIFVGAAYWLYRSLLKEKGSCAGCCGPQEKEREKHEDGS